MKEQCAAVVRAFTQRTGELGGVLMLAATLGLGCSSDRVNGGAFGNGEGGEGDSSSPAVDSFGGNGSPDGGEGGSGDGGGGSGDGTGTGDGQGTETQCTSAAECSDATPHCDDSGHCVECLVDGDCPEGNNCFAGACVAGACEPDARVCDGNLLVICNEGGTGFDSVDCSPGVCEGGDCKGCEPGMRQCSGATLLECDGATGTYLPIDDCGEAKLCSNFEGKCLTCLPKVGECDGATALVCRDDGSGFDIVDTCGAGESCVFGKCISACASNIKLNTNVGCDYWAVDLDNFNNPADAVTAANAQYAVVVNNVSDDPADVTIRSSDSGPVQASATVPGQSLHIFNLPSRNVDGTTKAALAWRVQSTQPIVAYQFNPLENVGVYSNDASVLFPSNAWGTEYLAMSWKQYENAIAPPTTNGFVTVVAGFENTEVTIVPAGATRAGGSVPKLSKGETWTTTLQPYEVLSIESGAAGVDLTGTLVKANKPVGVFSGHECARTSSDTCCCDHLEQQMIPTSAWGKTYVAVRSGVRNFEADHWRILAKENGTVVTTNPSQGPLIQLDAGEFYDLTSKQSFKIDANKPVLVGQFLASSFEINGSCTTGCAPQTSCDIVQGICFPTVLFCSGSGQSNCPPGHTCVDGSCEPIGDPAFILMPPVEQFLSDYVFLSPNNYVNDYLGVVAPVGAQLVLDDNQSISLTPLGPGAAWATATLAIGDGTHRITGSNDVKFGIVVHGFDDDVSYGYTGGLALESLDE